MYCFKPGDIVTVEIPGHTVNGNAGRVVSTCTVLGATAVAITFGTDMLWIFGASKVRLIEAAPGPDDDDEEPVAYQRGGFEWL